MIIAPERFASRRDTIAFLACVVLSISARLAPVGVQQAVSSAVTNTVLAPFLYVQRQAIILRTARTRVAQLTAQRDSAALDALQVFTLQDENAQLRELLGLSRRVRGRHVAAEVLHQAAPGDGLTLLLSAGRNHGVEPMDPVVAPGGLVGVIRRTDARTSVTMVWAHPDFRASAMTADGRVFGIVAPQGSEGSGAPLLELRGVPFLERLPIGTRVYTSGLGSRLGGVYPRGIPIGTIADVGEEKEGWSRTYVVRPAVPMGSVQQVIILTDDVGYVADAFEPEMP